MDDKKKMAKQTQKCNNKSRSREKKNRINSLIKKQKGVCNTYIWCFEE